MTAPFDVKAAELITGPLRHEAELTAHPLTGDPFALEIDGTDLAVTFSEDWSPYVQASISCKVPEDQEELDRLDPRKLCRVSINAGYTYPDNETEIFPLADLHLRRRAVNRPSNLLELTASSDESITQDYTWRADFPLMPTTGINEAVAWGLDFATIPHGYQLASAFGNGTDAADLAELAIGRGDSMWSMLDEIATRTGRRIYCDEFGIWQIRDRPELAGTPSHYLEVGAAGTLTDTSTELSREGWFNEVYLRNGWKDGAGNDVLIIGSAAVTSGEFAVGTVGWKCFYHESDRPITQDAANKAAATKLKNLVSRGRSLRLTAAAAYWLRPGMTVSVTLPSGAPALCLIQAITFHPLTGLMDITTRQPLNVTISTGE